LAVERIEVVPEGNNIYLNVYLSYQERSAKTTLGCRYARSVECVAKSLIGLMGEPAYSEVERVGVGGSCDSFRDSLIEKLENGLNGIELYCVGGEDD